MTRIDRVSEIAIYPLKGGHAATVQGEVPQVLEVGRTGFEVHGVRDRDWVLVDPNEGSFVSQRGWGSNGRRVLYPQDRKLATVAFDIQDDHMSVSSEVGTFELPTKPGAGRCSVLDIFGKQFPVVEQSIEGSQYFSDLLEREVQLMRADRENERVLPEKYQRRGAFNRVAGADGMPFLLASEASLIAAHSNNAMTRGSAPMNRYRPNIVISGSGLGAFGEDYIDGSKKFYIDTIGMWAVKACSRCPVPNVNQETGEVDGAALAVLRGRKGTIFTGETGVFFGQNLVHDAMGAIAVGDQVTVDHFTEKPNIDFAK